MAEQFTLDIEPESPPELPASQMALAQLLPNFPIVTLLQFLPDVRLKQQLEMDAAAAVAIDITRDGGLVAADAALVPVRTDIADIERCFADPTSLANQLHKRLTGLRADFCAAGVAAIETVGKRIYGEKRRLDDIAAAVRRIAQAEADKQAREAASRAAAEAAKAKAPKPVIEALKQAAKTATAPPVASPLATPALRSSTAVENWKCRLIGTTGDAEPNPKMADLTEPQRRQALLVVRAVLDGKAPLSFLEFSWGSINKRATSEKTTLAIPGLEAFDEGSIRSKGRR